MTIISDEVVCAPRSGNLYDVLDLILDRGIVIDAFVRVSLVGIEILKIDARIVVASVDTYLRFAEACNRLDLEHDARSRTVPELLGGVGQGVRKAGAKKAARSVGDKVREAIGAGDDDADDDDQDRYAEERESAEERRPRRKRAPERAGAGRARPRRKAEED